MVGWTVLTLRGRPASAYEFTREDSHDAWDATADLAATVAVDEGIRAWTTDSNHVYARLASDTGWQAAETKLKTYAPMLRDAVVLRANNTTDTGMARYYPTPEFYTDEFHETQDDGHYVGQLALAVINARHTILARDPFHDHLGRHDDSYRADGNPLQKRSLEDNATLDSR
ncbi:hypothetical protein [Halomarina oriensis]|uniref:Uncharacterized protein n=1 Tax=Halomarina oriensis TaxID=671145 RepID=A0A6B0GV93_9EURY|nr:hypothetical protein [Halomarina oriensis]MWG36503.1 hypothetical protein [Halomarina oriensis]